MASSSPVSDPYLLQAYDFDLPEELIAQTPAERRDAARLLVLDRESGRWEDRFFHDLPALLDPGDLLVLNNTRVFPARLRGRRVPGGGQAELLLLRERPDGTWEALAKPGRRLQPGVGIVFAGGRLEAEVVELLDDGKRIVRFESAEPFWEVIEVIGEPPLPPYIRRDAGAHPADRERYQTVYARERGAVAAPTAGLHFTPTILERVRAHGVGVAELTLHVGYGTFEPVRVDNLGAHVVAPERAVIPESTANAIARTRRAGGRVVAVGTTTTRALESASDDAGNVLPGAGMAALTILPGFTFRVVDAMITNFHLPRSSLLVMVASFAGRERLLAAYAHAVARRYRFYSYGDATFIN